MMLSGVNGLARPTRTYSLRSSASTAPDMADLRALSDAPQDWSAQDAALLALGQELKACAYRFTTVTPLTHRRVIARDPERAATTLDDVFGWSRPFGRTSLPDRIVALLGDAAELETAGRLLRSKVRFSTLGDQLFVHSSYPTDQHDAVFFGPDTYRFAQVIKHALKETTMVPPSRVVDIGCGSGVGGLLAASLLPTRGREIVLTDINPRALRYSRVNAALNGVAGVHTVESDLFAHVKGRADLIVSNPPYLVDPQRRAYRHGGGKLGTELALRIVEQGLAHLAPQGRLILYTGTPVIAGTDAFRAALSEAFASRGLSFTYEEIDPDVFGEELDDGPYREADRIAAVALVLHAPS
jgi:release factor glutamine methyltransferase